MTELTGDQRDASIALVEVLGQHCVETFETFYRRELPGLIPLARALSGSAYAEDFAQDAMLAAYRRWDEIQRYEFPVSWVRRVCANKAISAVRRRGHEARALVRLGSQRPEPPDIPEPVAEFWAQVRRLPRRQAQAVALFYLYDLPVAEVAATLDCSVGSVKTHLSRGRATLAQALAEADDGELS